jgi:antitoxin component YwqK of YwqJK toxin-antitoxin module
MNNVRKCHFCKKAITGGVFLAIALPATQAAQPIEWVDIPAGQFQMGNPEPAIEEWDEAPVHSVELTKPFQISKTEITVDQFREFRPGYEPPANAQGFAVGVSWEDAVAYCAWLTEREGVTCRLPTEAEWEWTARLSGGVEGDDALPVQQLLSGPREWCWDTYGLYSSRPQVDPVGAAGDFSKVIRGGGDNRRALTARVTNRSSYGGDYTWFPHPADIRSMPATPEMSESLEGLVGNWFGRLDFTRPRGFEVLPRLDIEWDKIANNWAGRYYGYLAVQKGGEYVIRFESDYGGFLEIDGRRVLGWSGERGQEEATVSLEGDSLVPVTVAYFHNYGDASYLRVSWKHEDASDFVPITGADLKHTSSLRFEGEDVWRAALGSFAPIGFRVVRAVHPDTPFRAEDVPFVRRAIAQTQPFVTEGPPTDQPHYRRRFLLPIPPDNVPRRETRLAGFHPVIMDHNHSPAMTVLPNGDVLFISYSSEREYEPETAMIATRLRFGADQWDMPEVIFDFADANEHAPCLYTDRDTGKTWFFWGTPSMRDAFPFQWTTSDDNGATWTAPRFPEFPEPVGSHSRQPISGPFRTGDGTLYLPSDGRFQDSVLWATNNDGKTWRDTGGRSAGRHTVYVELNDGRIMALGGKNTDIDGFQPVVFSSDGGETWSEPRATSLPGLGSNQRPSLIRLQSGRLFYCGDFQHRTGAQPEGFLKRGALVALSEDEGETWIMKKLPGALPHEADGDDDTLGYSSAQQAPNGVIHIATTMNTPCLHFEINEAWILDPEAGVMPISPVTDDSIQTVTEAYPDGTARSIRRFVRIGDGQPVLHGSVTFYYPNETIQYSAEFNAGVLVGQELLFRPDGALALRRSHRSDGVTVFNRYDEDGRKRSETHWIGHLAHGPAHTWDASGNLVATVFFDQGRLVTEDPD